MKRRDQFNRVLQQGESQRSDGRYEYKWTDANGVRHSVYSWRLTKTDRVPQGKRNCEPLRDQEKRIHKDMLDGILTKDAENVTFNDRMDLWFADQTKYLDRDTVVSYRTLFDKHVRNGLGRRKLSLVKHSDIVRLYTEMVEEKGLSVSTAQSLNSCVGQMFELAVQDDLIRSNPAKGATSKLAVKHRGDKEDMDALTAEQQRRLLAFVRSSFRFGRMYNLLAVLFGTGMRIAEALGLTRDECNFRQGRIHVCRQLRYRKCDDGHYQFILKQHTKTSAGLRDIPMLPDIRRALMEEANKSRKVKNEFTICPMDRKNAKPVSGFVFLNNEGKPFSPSAVYDIIQSIVAAYNKQEVENAKAEGRNPVCIPKMGPHTCRHSFATRLYEAKVDPLVIKTVMGHESYRTTAETYIDVGFEISQSALTDAADVVCFTTELA